MIKVENGKNIKWESKSGTVFYIHNINGQMVVFNRYGSARKPTKEMMQAIRLA